MPFKVENRKFRASRKANRIRKSLISLNKQRKYSLKMITQRPQALTLFRRYQQVGATKYINISNFRKRPFEF